MKIVRGFLWIFVLVLIIFLFLKPEKKEKLLRDGSYENCYMLFLEDDKMTVFVEDRAITLDCPLKNQEKKKDRIVDLQVENNRVTKITWKEGLVEDKVESLNLEEGWINFSVCGRKTLSSKGKLYIKTGKNVRLLQKPGSLLNREKVFCYIYNDEICAVVAEGEENLQSIKVLLHGEIGDIFHEEVRVTATENYMVIIDGIEKSCSAGKEISFTKDMGVARISCPEGKIKILSMKRASGYPEYRGEISVFSYEEGFLLRNELQLEEYLYGVVSSEMPASYPKEALKAQAVCARTYAIYQMEQAYYGEYGAHVDDTVNSQVYNNVKETESTKNAVQETEGQYLSYEGSPIPSYFYSTSCGVTSDVKDVWIGEGKSPVYLTGRFQGPSEKGTDYFNEKDVDYSSEKAFRDFIKNDQSECFEKEEPWFRWSGSISYDDLTEHVEKNLRSWLKGSPAYYRVEGDEKSLGEITQVSVESRSKGGVIKSLSLTGEKGILFVTGEYQIRKVLCPEETTVTLKGGNIKKCTMLPSGYFTVEQKEGEEEVVLITGGGYGHGVGMSQNGAKALAELGKTSEEILEFYYLNTVILEV